EIPSEVVPAIVLGVGLSPGQPVPPGVPPDDAVPARQPAEVHDDEAVFFLHAADEPVPPQERQPGAFVAYLDLDASKNGHGRQSCPPGRVMPGASPAPRRRSTSGPTRAARRDDGGRPPGSSGT